jgi:DegV family protein with EDD domain
MIRIITDSTSGITPDVARQRGIEVVSLYLNYDGAEHVESEMDIDAFYQTIDQRVSNPPKSSQPSSATLENIFEEAAAAGDSVLGVFLSTRFSGTLDGALRAARAVKAHNLDFECMIVDSASVGYDEAFCVLAACDTRAAGGTLAECALSAERAAKCSRILFAPESLKFLRAGGRIGAAASLLGSIIQITPILMVKDGQADTLAKVRTVKKANAAMLNTFKSDIERFGFKNVMVHYIGKKTEALEAFKKSVEEIVGRTVDMLPVSPVLGSHVGPCVGIAYECLQFVEGKFGEDMPDLVHVL